MSDAVVTAPPQTMKKYMPVLFTSVSMTVSLGILLILPYLSFFLTDYMGMSLGMLAIVLSGCTLADWACTVFSGAVVQKVMTRWGHYRFWLVISPVWILFTYCVVFWGFRSSDLVMAIIVIACYGSSGFCWQTIQISSGALMAMVAGSSTENRLKITSTQAIGMRILTFVTGLITGPFIKWGTEHGLNPYFILTLIYNGIVILPNLAMFVLTKEIDVYDPNFKAPTSTSNFGFFEMYKETFTNRHFLVLFASAVVTGLGGQAVSPLNTFYYRYSLAGQGGLTLLALASTISTPVAIFSASIARPFARKIGKKNSTVFVRYFAVIMGICTALFTDGNFVAKVIIVSITTFSAAISSAWGNNLYQDVAEYQEYTTGKDMRGFVLGMSNMTARLSAVIGTPIAAFVLQNSGYDAAAQSFANTSTMVLFIGLAPAIASLLGGILFHIGYKLTDAQAAEYAEANQERKAKAAAEAAAGTQNA